MSQEVKSGIKTTEFWTAFISVVGAVAVGVAGVLDQLMQTGVIKDGSVLAVVATVVSGVVAAIYGHQRSKVKVAALQDPRVVDDATKQKVNHV